MRSRNTATPRPGRDKLTSPGRLHNNLKIDAAQQTTPVIWGLAYRAVQLGLVLCARSTW
jgi:hypothetical protein